MKIAYPLLILLCVAGLTVGLVLADTVYKLSMPQRAGVESTTELEIKIEDAVWTNGTMVDWGNNLTPGDSIAKTLTFKNTGTRAINTITFTAEGLPNGWAEDMGSIDTPLNPGATLTAVLTLTPAINATSQVYLWTCYFTVT